MISFLDYAHVTEYLIAFDIDMPFCRQLPWFKFNASCLEKIGTKYSIFDVSTYEMVNLSKWTTLIYAFVSDRFPIKHIIIEESFILYDTNSLRSEI